MINYNNLQKDTRFKDYSEFTQKILGSLNLSDMQVDQLLTPRYQVCEDIIIDDVIDFIKNSKKLMIFGDYDADGVASTSISIMIAKHLGVEDVGYYIPNRFEEGYGLNTEIVKASYLKGYSHLLVVDNGVKAHTEIEYAKSLGLKVAVVDHHLIEKPLDDVLLLHPEYLEGYFNTMCASGLMYLVAERLNFLTPKIKAYAALATIADVMPLWNKNREIVKVGLEAMNENPIANIDALSKVKNYSAKDLAFQVVPKINSVGRMADIVNMNTMVKYLLSDDEVLIQQYAKQVLSINDLRKNKGKTAKNIAMRQVDEGPINIIIDNSIHEGVLGIVANQVCNYTMKPAILLKRSGDVYKGSGRSNSISLKELFSKINPDYFEAFGGHDFAFGMSVKSEMIESFIEDVETVVLTLPKKDIKQEAILIDNVSISLLQELKQFEPFGEGFQLPMFALEKPKSYKIIRLNGYGYKYVFDDFWLKDAVYFNTEISQNELHRAQYLVGSFNIHPRFGLSFLLDMVK